MAEIQRDSLGHFLPGYAANPSGRPPVKVSLVKLFADRLANEPATASAIISAWIDACKERDMPAIREALDRIDGKVASEVNMRALIVHIGDDYAREGLEAVKRDFLERQERYLLTEGTEKGNEKDS